MIIAATQTKPISGDIDRNMLDHLRLMKLAADKNADLILFPELFNGSLDVKLYWKILAAQCRWL